jgi:acyl carrier protein
MDNGTGNGAEMDERTCIREFLRDCFILDGGFDALGDDASFLENGIVDSTGVLELVVFVEETFGIEVADHEVVPENFDSVNRIVAYITAKENEGGTISGGS